MLTRPEKELQLVKPNGPLPTVEIDIDSLPEELQQYGDFVVDALTPFASNSGIVATIYIYQGPSVNFHQQTWSAFFGVANSKSLLDAIFKSFSAIKDINIRYSDFISPSSATTDFHIQDGHVWRPYEAGTWYCDSGDSTSLADGADATVEQLNPIAGEFEQGISRMSIPTRFRSARADASVGAIRKTIEDVFGLLEGSVALCGPDKVALRANATIATLRKRWE
jgi:hypothetical protein